MAERMRTSKIDAIIAELESLERIDGESENLSEMQLHICSCLQIVWMTEISNQLKSALERQLRTGTQKYNQINCKTEWRKMQWQNFMLTGIMWNRIRCRH